MPTSTLQIVELLNRWGDAHGRFAAAMALQACLLLAVLAGLDLLVLRRLRASVRYAVWSLMLVKLLLPVTLATPISIGQWLPDVAPLPSETVAIPSREIAQSGPPSLESARSYLMPAQGSTALAMHADPPEPPLPDVADRNAIDTTTMVIPPSKAVTPAAASPAATRLNASALLLLLWCAGMAALCGFAIRHALRVRRIVRNTTAPPAELLELFTESARRYGMSLRRIQLRISDGLNSPAISGFWSGTVLLPRALLNSLDHDQLRFILVHELAHWRRGDLQINTLQTCLQILYFYNPAVWIVNAILRRLREQAVDEAVLVALDAAPAPYSDTLLNIASAVRGRMELSVRLIGVVESGRALSGRIRRMLKRPIPRTARLGITGIAAVFVCGLLLLPMACSRPTAGSSASDAIETSEPKPQSVQPAEVVAVQQPTPASEPAAQPASRLFGRVVDTTGAPVADAEIRIHIGTGGREHTTRTDSDGAYRFSADLEPEEYSMSLYSERCVGFANRTRQSVTITADGPTERNLTLPLAARIRVRTVDEAGNPIRRTSIMALLVTDDGVAPEPVHTGDDGWVTLGSLPPSPQEYRIVAWHDDYGFELHTSVLDDPAQVPTHEFVLRAGKSVSGKAVCSDGKPPAGWRILALPTWWNFGRSPSGTTIEPDGSFTLPHILPGKFNVTISVPMGEFASSPRQVLAGAELWGTDGELAVKLDHPSPASLVYINGRITIEGSAPKGGFWIFANSTDQQQSSSTHYRDGEDKTFQIGPVPPGEYTLKVEKPGVQSDKLVVKAPADDVELVVRVAGQPRIAGIVTDAESQQPVTNFRLRVIKLRTLSGPNFVGDTDWHDHQSDAGQFETEFIGPGVYQLQVAADGYAPTLSEQVNTDEHDGSPLQVALARGVSLIGAIVDETGAGIDSATILPLSYGVPRDPSQWPASQAPDAIQSANGRFEIPHLPPGVQIFKVTHPDFAFATVTTTIGGANANNEPLKIKLQRGATVQGHVFDAQGRPEAGVTLFFQEQPGHSEPVGRGRIASVTTDAAGHYEVQHLPDQMYYVVRDNEWESLGVVQHGIRAENGRRQTLDIGGTSEVSGRLLIDGTPAATLRLVISGSSPHFGPFKAYAQTTADGTFVFRGIPPGNRTLYYKIPERRNDYGRLRELRLPPEGLALGEIDHRTGQIEVRIEPAGVAAEEGLSLQLQDYNPIWAHGNPAGFARRDAADGQFVIEQVPPGEYELVCFRGNRSQLRQRVDVTLDSLNQQLTLTFPVGTASLSGKLDGEICGPNGCSSIKVWSEDGSWLSYILPQTDGTYRLDGVPAGSYRLRDKDTRTAPVLVNVELADNEQKTLDLTPNSVTANVEEPGFLEVHAFTAEGVLVPCEMRLVGSDGELTPHSSQDGRIVFAAPPGEYELVVRQPGFPEARQQVNVQPLTDEARRTESYSVTVTLRDQGA